MTGSFLKLTGHTLLLWWMWELWLVLRYKLSPQSQDVLRVASVEVLGHFCEVSFVLRLKGTEVTEAGGLIKQWRRVYDEFSFKLEVPRFAHYQRQASHFCLLLVVELNHSALLPDRYTHKIVCFLAEILPNFNSLPSPSGSPPLPFHFFLPLTLIPPLRLEAGAVLL